MLWNEMEDGKKVITRRFSDCYRQIEKKHSESFPKTEGPVHPQKRDSGQSGLIFKIKLFLDKPFFSFDRLPSLVVAFKS